MELVRVISPNVYLVNLNNNTYVLKFSIAKNEASIWKRLSKDPDCNQYIVCMYKYFDVDYQYAYALTNGYISRARRPKGVGRMIEGKLVDIVDEMFHPTNLYTAILLESMETTVTDLYIRCYFMNNER